jgi:hypothetical protein
MAFLQCTIQWFAASERKRMTSAMMALRIAVGRIAIGSAALICYLPMTRLQNRPHH